MLGEPFKAIFTKNALFTKYLNPNWFFHKKRYICVV
jgi:hypothetical protein